MFLDEIGELGLDEQAMLLRAIEEKRFLPVGADRETESDFQLIAGTNRELHSEVARGAFREDLFARINLWTFCMPGLAERREDLAPNLDYELERFAAQTGRKVTINREGRELFLRFGESPSARWIANFRDLNAAVTRMATLCGSGRITAADVQAEIARLERGWRESQGAGDIKLLQAVLAADRLATLDLFEQAQLASVIRSCRGARSLSEAGRALFAVSRQAKVQPNDADRLRKYLSRFGLSWSDVASPTSSGVNRPE